MVINKSAVLLALPAIGVSVAVTPLVVLGQVPKVMPVTCNVTEQPPDGRLGIVKFNAVAPITRAGLLVTPTQVPPMVVEATLMFVSVSLKFAFVNGPALMLPRVKVMVLVPPGAMAVGAKDLMIVGNASTIRSSLVASALLPPSVTSAPAAIVLVYVPSTLAVTSTVIVQPPGGMLVPLENSF